MKVFHSHRVAVELPPGHRFPMPKYARLRDALLARGVLAESDLHPADETSESALCAAHDPAYVADMLAGRVSERAMRKIGFPWSAALVARSRASVGGTLAAARAAAEDGISGNLAGGTHHAFRDHGAGYCIFNDLAVTARTLIAEGLAQRILVCDVDVHQGDGTAAIFADDPRVFTLSLHGAKNFPFQKQRSDLDVELADDTGDEAYLEALGRALPAAFDLARPDFVLVQAGVDPLEADRLGRLSLTLEGLRARDRLILDTPWRTGVPVTLTLGGGYADPLDPTVEAHVGTYLAARSVYR
jgi:acetoin utilization deacetylase AcuC-like enzyme